MTDERPCDFCGGETKNLRGMLQCQVCGRVVRADSVPLAERLKAIKPVTPEEAADMMRQSIDEGMRRMPRPDGSTDNPFASAEARAEVAGWLRGGRSKNVQTPYAAIMREIDRQMPLVLDHGVPIGVVLSPENYRALVYYTTAAPEAATLADRLPETPADAKVWQRPELGTIEDGDYTLPVYISDDPDECGPNGVNVKGRRRTREEAIAAAEARKAMTPTIEDRWSDEAQLPMQEGTEE